MIFNRKCGLFSLILGFSLLFLLLPQCGRGFKDRTSSPIEPVIPETITVVETFSGHSAIESFSYAKYNFKDQVLVNVPEINGAPIKEEEPFGYVYSVNNEGNKLLLEAVKRLQEKGCYLYEKKGARVKTYAGKRCMGTSTIIALEKGDEIRLFYQCGNLDESPLKDIRNMLIKYDAGFIGSNCVLAKELLSRKNRNVVNITTEMLTTMSLWPSNESDLDNVSLIEESELVILRLSRWYYQNMRPTGTIGWYEDIEQMKKQEATE